MQSRHETSHEGAVLGGLSAIPIYTPADMPAETLMVLELLARERFSGAYEPTFRHPNAELECRRIMDRRFPGHRRANMNK